ncbi:hypothetical protein KIPB_006054, partial [Kipferlia bialata]|eukprot:g6054.t1
MFFEFSLNQLVTVPPSEFTPKLNEKILERLENDFGNAYSEKYGHIVSITSVGEDSITDLPIRAHDGTGRFLVKFK